MRFIGSSNSLTDALLVFFSSKKPDIVFIDTETKTNEWQVLFQALRLKIPIALISSNATISSGIFDVDNVFYLARPYKYEHFLKCEAILQGNVKQYLGPGTPELIPQNFFIQTEQKGQFSKIHFAEVIFIESNGNYLTVHHVNGQYECHLRLIDMEKGLPKNRFARIHKSFIVNVEKIKTVKLRKVLLDNGIALPIGNTYKNNFMSLIRTKTMKANCLLVGLVSIYSDFLCEIVSANELWFSLY